MNEPVLAHARKHRLDVSQCVKFFNHADLEAIIARRRSARGLPTGPAPPSNGRLQRRQQRGAGGPKPVSQDPAKDFSDDVSCRGSCTRIWQGCTLYASCSPARLDLVASRAAAFAQRCACNLHCPACLLVCIVQMLAQFKTDTTLDGETILLRNVKRMAGDLHGGRKWVPVMALEELPELLKKHHEQALAFKCGKKLFNHVRGWYTWPRTVPGHSTISLCFAVGDGACVASTAALQRSSHRKLLNK